MKVLKFINYLMILLNIAYIILLNVFYVQLPVPNKIYLKDIKTGGILPNSFINIGIGGLIINIIIALIYIILIKNNIKEKRLNSIIILFEILCIIIGIVYQLI